MMTTCCDWGVWLDLHVGVAPWRERWVTHRQRGRIKGVWDAKLTRQSVILPDQRRLTYVCDAAADDDDHAPYIVVLHGMCLSGNAFLMDSPPSSYHLICINRPGYFGSDPPPADYSYRDLAHDIFHLVVRNLQISKFYVAGHSSGGPCALACAAHLGPDHILGVGILSGDPEYAHPNIPSKRRLNSVCLGCFLPNLLWYLSACIPLARYSYHGMRNDYRLETNPYDFQTEDIVVPALIYTAEDDGILPFHISRHVHERLACAKWRTVRKTGHLGLLRDAVLQEFFAELVQIDQLRLTEESNDSGLVETT